MAIGTPSLESAHAARAAADEEERFWREHYRTYLEQYPDQFVAVASGCVVATSSDLRHLVGILEGKDLEPRAMWVHYIAAEPLLLISSEPGKPQGHVASRPEPWGFSCPA